MEIKKDEQGNNIELTPEELKDALKKAEEERENYKQGLLERDSKLKELKNAKKDDEDDSDDDMEDTNWDDASKRFQEETISKTQKSAEEIVNKTIESRNEKVAITDFREANPDITDEQWTQIMSNYNPKHGKDSVKGIMKDLERAEALRKFDAGEVMDPATKNKVEAETRLKEMSTNNGINNSGRYEQDKSGPTTGQKQIAARMRVPEDKIKLEDDSLSAEIKIVN